MHHRRVFARAPIAASSGVSPASAPTWRTASIVVGACHSRGSIRTSLPPWRWMTRMRETMPTGRASTGGCPVDLAVGRKAQCRAASEALAEIKNPRPVHAREAKRSHENELFEHEHGERLNARTTGATGGTDPQLVAWEQATGRTHLRSRSRHRGMLGPAGIAPCCTNNLGWRIQKFGNRACSKRLSLVDRTVDLIRGWRVVASVRPRSRSGASKQPQAHPTRPALGHRSRAPAH